MATLIYNIIWYFIENNKSVHPTPCVTFYFKLQMKTVNLPLHCCKTTILTDKNAPKLQCIFSKLLFLPPNLRTYISVLGTAEAITVLYLLQLFTVTFRKCVSRQDIFCPFGWICFTYLFLTWSLNSVCRADPANPLPWAHMIQEAFIHVCIAEAECTDFHIYTTFESHVHKEALPQTFPSSALEVGREQTQQTSSSWFKIQRFIDSLAVPSISDVAEWRFSSHILCHDPLQWSMWFGTNWISSTLCPE